MKLVSLLSHLLCPVAVVVIEPLLAMSAGEGEIAARIDTVPSGLAADDWSGIRAAYEAGRHKFFATEDGHRARSPGQRWTARFDGGGFTVRPDAGDWEWGLALVRYGVDGREHDVALESCASVDAQRLTYDRHATLSEWFVNDTRGLEHGFTVNEMPNGDGTLFLDLAVRGELRPQIHGDARGVSFVDTEGARVLTYTGLSVFDADGRALPAGFEVTTDELRLFVDTHGAHFPVTIDPIAQQAYLKASNTGASDEFGRSIAVYGDTVVVGAYHEDSNATGVNGNQSSNSAVDSGAAYVFARTGTIWSQQAYLKASNTGPGAEFGASVSVSGNTVVVGAPLEGSLGSSSGAAYVFARNGATWSQQAHLKATNAQSGDSFGWSVSLSGDSAVIGTPYEDSNTIGVNGDEANNAALNSGAAYVFVRSGTTWSQEAYLKASNTETSDGFGGSVSISGDMIIVGAEGEDSGTTGINGDQTSNSAMDSGAAYAFVRGGAAWSQQAYLKASNTTAGDTFGASVSMSGDMAVIGALGEDSNATGVNGNQSNNGASSSGAAYVFVRGSGTWNQHSYLKASNPGPNDQFGASVSVSGDFIAIGAPFERSNATGVNGNQNNNSSNAPGAAYVFARVGTTWSQQAYLKASNTEAFDFFGLAVAVSDDTAAVGAVGESSNATGANGDQSNNGATLAGAAYIFDLNNPLTYCSGGATTSGCHAWMSALGSPSVSAISGFILAADGVEGQKAGLIFYGVSGPMASVWAPGSTSYLCVKSPVQRTPSQSTGGTGGGCDGVLSIDLLDYLANNAGALGNPFSSGRVVHAQAWFRDPPAPGTTNLSNGLQFTTVP